ncbi:MULTISPECIES: protein phosphatase 2C domain-containing protein [Clostridium]|uniref:protein phosphatase 2C domain-containing protein n=1 Tax=Clostridium TaxID=1485 RepID=UPI001159C2C7|nr:MULTISPECIES: protein phosphatase 2C domain-containing protein [Clostridium]MDU1569041.1 protein phosphatase 2C domain-containing protein [Clostridium sp.]MDU2157180.1 protein phosphatase 2C domain-containing protein [Clostridium sp.]MDU3406793.1 protein phosphatase 2C domain-containing protein [Clostridium sp.]MDU4739545.1 protein phosphatase 2C domain-containing protein [Clostridium sp.]
MKNIKFLSKQGNSAKPNEDKITVLDNAAWILDGATGLTGKRITEKETDALWYVEALDDYLKKHINSSKDIKEIIKNAIKEVKEKYSKYDGFNDLEEIDYPCAALALVRLNSKELEYYVIGDCTLIYSQENESIKEIVDRKLIGLEENILRKMREVSKVNNISVLDARRFCNDEVISVRKLKNKLNGYWILEFNEDAVDRGLYNKISINGEISICITSDGFSQFYDTFNLAEDYKAFINLLKESNVEDIFNTLYEEQEKDSNCNDYPRLKKRDDTSIIYFEL